MYILNTTPELLLAEAFHSGSIKNIHLYLNFVFFGFKIAVFSILICSSFFCILALGSGQRLLYRLGLVLALVLRFCVEVNILNVSLSFNYMLILAFLSIM